MPVQRRCERCGKAFTARNSRARFCGNVCRSEAHRGKAVALVPQPKTGLTESLVAELETAERLSTTLGQAALAIASRIDAGGETGAAIASLSRELRALRSEVLADVAPKGSKVETMRDELAERRHA